MKKCERTVRIFLAAVFLAVLLLFLIPGSRLSAHVVLSGSMEPALGTGGIVFTDKTKTEPEIGEIITYRLSDTLVTHRVVGKQEGSYVTKGDANPGEDAQPVDPGQILGTVVFFVPILGYWAVFFRQKTVLCLILLMLVQELVFYGIQQKGERRRTAHKQL